MRDLYGFDVPFTVHDNCGGQRRVTVQAHASNMAEATLIASAQMRVLGYQPGEFEPFLETPAAQVVTDSLDYERRWLAECRAHGHTQRKLEALLLARPLRCETCGARQSEAGRG